MNDRLSRWLAAEREAQIRGWDFSPITGKFHEDDRFPWDYGNQIRRYVKPTDRILDMDTGGGEKLLALEHNPARTAASGISAASVWIERAAASFSPLHRFDPSACSRTGASPAPV